MMVTLNGHLFKTDYPRSEGECWDMHPEYSTEYYEAHPKVVVSYTRIELSPYRLLLASSHHRLPELQQVMQPCGY